MHIHLLIPSLNWGNRIVLIKKIHLGNLIMSFISSVVSLVLACACTHTHTQGKQPGNVLRYTQLTFHSLEVTKPQFTLSRTKTLDIWPSTHCAPEPLMGICRASPTSSNTTGAPPPASISYVPFISSPNCNQVNVQKRTEKYAPDHANPRLVASEGPSLPQGEGHTSDLHTHLFWWSLHTPLSPSFSALGVEALYGYLVINTMPSFSLLSLCCSFLLAEYPQPGQHNAWSLLLRAGSCQTPQSSTPFTEATAPPAPAFPGWVQKGSCVPFHHSFLCLKEPEMQSLLNKHTNHWTINPSLELKTLKTKTKWIRMPLPTQFNNHSCVSAITDKTASKRWEDKE